MTRTHTDPTPLFVDELRTLFGTTAIVAREHVPDSWQLLTSPPLITVHDDSGPEQWPIRRDPIIRITVRAHGEPLAKQIAAQANGHLHDHWPAGVAAIRRNGGGAFVIASDTETGADMASFTLSTVMSTTENV